MFNIIKRHKIRTGVVLACLLAIGIILLLKYKIGIEVFTIISTEKQQEIMFLNISINNWCTFITIFGLISGGLWGLHEYDTRKKESKQEKAAEIAKQFASEILTDMTIVGEILKKYKPLQKIYNNIDLNKLKRVDIYEFKKIITNNSINHLDLIKDFLSTIKSKEIDNYFHNYIKKSFPEKKSSELLETPFSHFMIKTLNKLEAISINISSNAAGTEYIYPSLHQVLLPFIEKCSPYISAVNENYTYKYFINTIDVYNNWKKIREQELNKESKERKNIQKNKEKYINKMQKNADKYNTKMQKNADKYNTKINKIIDKSLDKKPRKL